MQKEKLNIDNIKTDISNEIKYNSVEFIALTLLLITLLAFVFWVPIIIYKVLFGCLAVATFFLVAKRFLMYINLYTALYNTDCIVKDKLVGMEEKFRKSGHFRYITHYLHFSEYGDYKIPDKNYRWSSAFSMGHHSVYNSANCGDEFYLVLSKLHTGKIVYAYNTKMFNME